LWIERWSPSTFRFFAIAYGLCENAILDWISEFAVQHESLGEFEMSETGKVARIGDELRSADDEPGGYDEEQEQSDVNASKNVRPLPTRGDGNFTSENGTDEHTE